MTFKSIGLVVAVTFATFAGLNSNSFALNINESIEGFWYEADLSASRGWGLQYLKNGPEKGVLFAAGYIYDDEGNAVWVAGNTTVYDGQFETTIPLALFEGGSMGPERGNPVAVGGVVGYLNIVFNSCNSADFSFSGGEGPNFTLELDSFLTEVGGSKEGRCVYQREFNGCPQWASPGMGQRSCAISDTFDHDIVLTNEINWELNGVVYIGARPAFGTPVPLDGPTITIEAGTRIRGFGQSALVISRGSKIIAEGQPHAPIVMTGYFSTIEGARPGDWGGLVINGAATINNCDSVNPCENEGEGETGAYGGTNDDDDSGVLRYVRVQYAGGVIDQEQEDDLPGISFLGVGRGTVVDYVQVHANHDDGFKFQGGTVNAKHLVFTDVESDSLDFSEGYQGKIQHALIWQINDETGSSDYGIETENDDENDALPRTRPTMANVTMVGKMGEGAIEVSQGSGGRFSNFVVSRFGECIDIDDPATFQAAGSPGNPTGELLFTNSVFFCHVDFAYESGDPWVTQTFVSELSGNSTQTNVALEEFIPYDWATYLSGYPLDTGYYGEFFDDVGWIGAFRSRDSAWHYRWTEFLPQLPPVPQQ